MISINKTKNLWNNDKKFKKIKSSFRRVPLCCWFWCWWVINN